MSDINKTQTILNIKSQLNIEIIGSTKALATVTAIIDGTGSIGAAVGPFLAGVIPGDDTDDQLKNTFYMLIACQCMSLLVSIY